MREDQAKTCASCSASFEWRAWKHAGYQVTDAELLELRHCPACDATESVAVDSARYRATLEVVIFEWLAAGRPLDRRVELFVDRDGYACVVVKERKRRARLARAEAPSVLWSLHQAAAS